VPDCLPGNTNPLGKLSDADAELLAAGPDLVFDLHCHSYLLCVKPKHTAATFRWQVSIFLAFVDT
jgi:hypothetical protein